MQPPNNICLADNVGDVAVMVYESNTMDHAPAVLAAMHSTATRNIATVITNEEEDNRIAEIMPLQS